MNFFKNFSIRSLLFNKKIAIGLSVFVAVLLWLIIAIDQSPERERTISKLQIQVDTSSIWGNENLEVVGDIATTASVTVYGPNYVVSSLSPEDITVSADLSKVTGANTYEISLIPTNNGKENNFSFVSISPATITLEFDYYESKTVEAVPIIEGYEKVDGENLIYDSVFTSGNKSTLSVDVKGFRKKLNKLSKIEVKASANEVISESKVFSDPKILLLDDEGQALDSADYNLPYENLPIALMVSKEKTLNVAPTYSNMWNSQIAAELKNYWKTETKTITLKGAPNVIESISAIEYENPIDLFKLSDSVGKKVTFELIPKLPEGVTISDAIEKISFNFDLSRLAVKNFYITNVSHENTLKSGLSVAYDNHYSVTVCGPKYIVNSLSASDM